MDRSVPACQNSAMWLKLLLTLALVYGALVMTLFLAQSWLLFPKGIARSAAPLPASAELLKLRTPTGELLHGAHIPPARPGRDRIVILGFGGNGWNANATARYLHDLYPEADIVAFHFRGYAPSEGRPSAAALVADAPLIHDLVRDRFGAARIVATGFSVGGGVAAALAARRPLDGLILVTPFDSLTEVAAGHYPWLPVRLLFRHRLEPAADLGRVHVPVALVAGERDRVIPVARAEALRRAVPNVVLARTIAGAGHNDIYHEPAFRDVMREALDRVLTPQEPS